MIATDNSPTTKCSGIKAHFEQLQSKCSDIFNTSLNESNLEAVATSHLLVGELELWCEQLSHRRESELLRMATLEYQFALLALTQGYYRHSFKGLRLVLEMILQAVYLSSDELCLREWIRNQTDTVWSLIVDKDNGVFSPRFSAAFFPTLSCHISHYRGLAKSIYRECSECVHGNIPKHIPLPSALTFDQKVFDLWHAKANIVSLVSQFALSLRYLSDLGQDVSKFETPLSERLGHIPEIRQLLGGPISE